MDQVLADDMTITELPPAPSHERLLHASDPQTGLNALISLHSTKRGPAAGCCRMFPYTSMHEAIRDVERLSQGMTYKNTGADLPLGGGKAVIIGGQGQKTPALMRAFGRFVNSLHGAYYTAEDVGISPRDLAYAAEESPCVVGLNGGPFASGDPSPHTAEGVFRAMQVAWAHLTGRDSLANVTVAVQGLGHVGLHLAEKLHEAGARLIVSDLSATRLAEAQARFGAVHVPPAAITAQEADIFAPCAMGEALNPESVADLRVRAVVGAANNQLASDAMGQALQDRGILYAPDYIVNSGGIVNVAMEILKTSDPAFRQARLEGLAVTLSQILRDAKRSGTPPHRIADRMVEARLRAI